MNSLIKKLFTASLIIVLNACAHSPQHYSSYPAYGNYSNGYVVKRSYYGVAPYHYPPPRVQQFSQPIPPSRVYVYPSVQHNQWQNHNEYHETHKTQEHHVYDNDAENKHRLEKERFLQLEKSNSRSFKSKDDERHDFNPPSTSPYRPQGFAPQR